MNRFDLKDEIEIVKKIEKDVQDGRNRYEITIRVLLTIIVLLMILLLGLAWVEKLWAAPATHVLILEVGDTGHIQCPAGQAMLTDTSVHQVSALCAELSTATPTASEEPTATETGTSTATQTMTPTATPTPSPTTTRTPTSSATASLTPLPTFTLSPTASATLTPTPTPSETFLPLVMNLAVIGDSVQDEYRANDNRGSPYFGTTFNWVEMLTRYRGVNVGAWGTRAEPRRSGYEFNWARSGATSASAWSQLNGIVAQINAGQVTHVFLQIGLNDLNANNLAMTIYAGGTATTTLNTIADNITGMANQANAVAPGRVMVAELQDFVSDLLLPEIVVAFPDPIGRQRISNAIAYVNSRVRTRLAPEVKYFAFNAALSAELATRRSGNVLLVGGQSILLSPRGNEYHNAWLNESPYAHAGTVLSGLLANVYMEALNAQFGTSLLRLTDVEIISIAGGP